ncbi:MAG: BadF/BadG/BcrA/BcrD ATPase family protein [Verrucomicrobiota bacterium]
MKTFLGVDGGGTKTRGLLIDESGGKLRYAEAGSSNLNSTDAATVSESLKSVIEECTSGLESLPRASCFGLAGASSEKAKRQLGRIISSHGLNNFLIISDAEVALEGAFNGAPGILLIAGTGSSCFGKDKSGNLLRTGGWGWLADDAGSASWIGQRALHEAMRQYDGRSKGSAIQESILLRLGIRNESEITSGLYNPNISRVQLAALAPIVIQLAGSGDGPALVIVQDAVHELAALVRSTAQRMDASSKKVVMSGGLVEHHGIIREMIRNELNGLSFQTGEGLPVEGAAAIALKHVVAEPT